MTQTAQSEQFRQGLKRPTLGCLMPLQKPIRLPRNLNRTASPSTRRFAMKHCKIENRRQRRRKEIFVRFGRRTAKVWSVVASEFRIWMLIAASGVLTVILGILLLSPFFDVRSMHIRRQDARIDPEEIQQTLSPLFKQRLVLVTKGQVAAMLQAEYPDIQRVEIGKEYPSTLNVTVYLDPVVAKVKIDDAGLPESGSGSSAGSGAELHTYLSRTGLFVASPITLTSAPLPTLTITDWGIRPENRTKILDPQFLQQIFLARDTLRRDFGLSTTGIVIYLRAKEFHIRTNKTTLWFDLESPLAVQFQRFRELLKTVSLDQVKEYADLRIADKIIYK